MNDARLVRLTRQQRDDWASVASALRMTGQSAAADMLDEQIVAAWDGIDGPILPDAHTRITNRWAAFTDDELLDIASGVRGNQEVVDQAEAEIERRKA